MRLQTVIVAAALSLTACATSKDTANWADDPYFSLNFAPEPPPVTDDFPPRGDAEAFTLYLVLERADLGRMAGPSVTTYAGQTANMAMVNDVPFGDDPARMKVEEGLRLEVAMNRASDGGVTIAYSVRLTRVERVEPPSAAGGAVVRPRMPDIERVEASGVRWLESGVQGLLARVPSPDGSGPMLVLARVVPIRIDAPAPGVLREPDARLARPMTGHTMHLRVSASHVDRDLEPGTVLDETAAPDMLKSAGGEVLRDFEIFSCLDSRVRLAGLLDTIGGTRGLIAKGRDDGQLDLEWTTTGDTRRATIRPNAGRRFVALARIEGGGTAGVLVSVDAD